MTAWMDGCITCQCRTGRRSRSASPPLSSPDTATDCSPVQWWQQEATRTTSSSMIRVSRMETCAILVEMVYVTQTNVQI